MSETTTETTKTEDLPGSSHGCATDVDHDREIPESDLLSPFTLRGLTFRNRIVMSPMCQYCAHEASPMTGTSSISAAGPWAGPRWCSSKRPR